MKLSVAGWQLFLVLLIVSLNCKSQDQSVIITSERKSDNSVDFSYLKRDYGSFYLNLTFTNLENAGYAFFKGVLDGMQEKFYTLRPLNPDKSIGFSYNYTWIRGVPNPKIDTNFVYLLPVSKGENIKALFNLNLSAKYFGSVEPKNWKLFQFNLDAGDTVFSIRKGLVVEVTDGNEPDSTSSYSYSSKSNSILIEHEDRTIARYDVLKNGSFMVKPGQKVLPHTPLALAGTYDVAKNTQIRFYIHYLCEQNIEKSDNPTLSTRKNYYAFVDPLFHTLEGEVHLESFQNYTADFSEEHILKELNKREKKKLGK